MTAPAGDSKPFARAGLLLAGLMWTIPFLQPYHRYPLTSFYSEWLAFAFGLLAAAMALLRGASWRKVEVPVVALAPVALGLVLMAQTALGRVPYAEQTQTAMFYLLWAALLVLVGQALKRALGLPAIAAFLAWFLLVGGLLSATTGLVQHFQISTPLDFVTARNIVDRAYGNVGQPNHHAAYLSFALASTAYLYCRRSLRGAWAAAAGAFLLLTLALTASRSPWIYLGAFVLSAGFLRRVSGAPGGRSLFTVTLWLLLGYLVAQLVSELPFMQAKSALTPMERLFQMASGIGPRLQLWSEAWQMFAGSPLLGAGWGQFSWHHFLQQAITDAAAVPGVYNNAHNIALQLLAETGLIGTSIVIGAAGLWTADFFRRAPFDPGRWWLFAVMTVIGIHSLLEFPLWYAYFLGVAAILAGVGAERVFTPRLAGAVRVVAGAAVLAGAVNLVAIVLPYREFERLVFVPQARPGELLDERAFVEAISGLYREPVLAPYVDLAVAYGATVSEDKLQEKLALTDRAQHFAPVSYVVYRHAMLLALAGERDAARVQFEQASRVYPEDLDKVGADLAKLDRAHPGVFAPLLELAAAGRRSFGRDPASDAAAQQRVK